jgi:hypothetical protein
MTKFIKVFNDTGNCEIDIDLVVKKWNHLFWVSQWNDEYRLIKYKQKNSPITVLKAGISKEQFIELKDRLKLVKNRDCAFRSASSWRKDN